MLKALDPMDRRRPRNIPLRPLVLVVDDHDDTREMYVESLVMFGFDAISAADSEQAYRRAWDVHPDIVVTHRTERRMIPPRPQCDAANAERVPPVVTESRLRWFRCRGCGRLWSIAPPTSSLP